MTNLANSEGSHFIPSFPESKSIKISLHFPENFLFPKIQSFVNYDPLNLEIYDTFSSGKMIALSSHEISTFCSLLRVFGVIHPKNIEPFA